MFPLPFRVKFGKFSLLIQEGNEEKLFLFFFSRPHATMLRRRHGINSTAFLGFYKVKNKLTSNAFTLWWYNRFLSLGKKFWEFVDFSCILFCLACIMLFQRRRRRRRRRNRSETHLSGHTSFSLLFPQHISSSTIAPWDLGLKIHQGSKILLNKNFFLPFTRQLVNFQLF